ncbi:uncharacterized protein EDB91DRAFT_1175938 [Suillus paluster]|uniref:uncharacterized protein n=1 Tax=Suillus paluster TaxID=48578 RepID=UPI001B86ECBF|nr:uncharacterized protein EDB91DRAFT_1175938 [Suillus paluster]KAG1721690.1 hypothetical protein EDB91DRAFT_1175938 [Suillus paluster]
MPKFRIQRWVSRIAQLRRLKIVINVAFRFGCARYLLSRGLYSELMWQQYRTRKYTRHLVVSLAKEMFKRTIIRLQHTVSPTFFPVQLVAIAFCTGILDATTYADFQTFASNQTGNAILLPVGMMGAANVQMLNTGTSLASFLFFGFLSGQVGHIFGHRKRWWMLLSLLIQALLLFLLATSAGFQVAMARNLGVNEIPTAMLTSPFIDFVTDRYLFTGNWSDRKVMGRNRRLICTFGVFDWCVYLWVL